MAAMRMALLSVVLMACAAGTKQPRARGAEAGDSGAGDTANTGDSGTVDTGEAPPTHAVLVTELLADNHDGRIDGDGEHVDWIEVHNPNAHAVPLDGWWLSDDPGSPLAHALPAVELPAGGFLVLYASGKTGSADPNEIHLPFKLDAMGEDVVLSQPDGTLVDRLHFPPQREDISWGRPQTVSTTVLVQDGSAARLIVGEENGWTDTDHDDDGWADVTLPVGFDVVDGDTTAGNLALFAPTEQSTSAYSRTGAEAVDGEWGTFSHTADGDLTPWWRVDLGQTSHIDDVTLLNRIGCCPERLYNITVEVLDQGGAAVWTSAVINPTAEGTDPANPGDTLDAGLPATTLGRYVRVSKVAVNGAGSTEWMSLAEVQVTGSVAAAYDAWIATDIGDEMRGQSALASVRVALDTLEFTPTRLMLDVRADDGFVAWLDGVEVASSPADVGVEVTEATRFEIAPTEASVLAVALHNVDADDPDALLGLTLTAQSVETDRDASAWFPVPTPGAPNGRGLEGFVDGLAVSPERGFFDVALAVSMTTATPGATIIYTLDGSEPSAENGTAVEGGEARLDVTTTATLRAIAVADGWGDSVVATHSYLYLDDVIRQPAAPEGVPATWDGASQAATAGDYEMDPEVVDDSAYTADLLTGLRAIPTLSIVMDPDDLWGATDGIYIHSTQRGPEWERPASIEYILPDDTTGLPEGTTGFQVDSGVRVHGYGWRPHSNTKKHSLRLEFRNRYGPSKLAYPLFPDAPVDRFDSIVLRSQGSRGWQDFRDPEQSQYIRDAFARDTAFAMDKADGHATLVHLYLNGLYWGLYMPVERPDADFGAERFGGDASEYDAINRRTTTNEAIDGDLEAYNQMLALSDQDLTVDANYRALAEMIDIDDLIDYMLIHQYTVNRDGPELFNHNNMRGVRRRLDGEQFRFFVWDMEYSIWYASDTTNINVDVAGSASHVYARLRTSSTFRARYAERARAHLTGTGALTVAASTARWEARALQIQDAVVAESARWGDAKRATPYTRDAEWETEHQRLLNDFFPYRTQALIDQLTEAGLY
jgi:hypothetical protein